MPVCLMYVTDTKYYIVEAMVYAVVLKSPALIFANHSLATTSRDAPEYSSATSFEK